MDKKTSIIIPTYQGLELLVPCVQAIRDFTEGPYEIIVVDNGSTDGTTEYCREQGLTFVSLPTNTGFPAACNHGLRIASGDALLLLNNDVVVTHRWLPNMLNCLYSSEAVGVVGPYTNYASGRQQQEAGYGVLEEFHPWAAQHNRPDAARWVEVQRLVGLCLLFKRELMERIGILDERFSPGHFEDDDFGYRARLAGYKLMIAGDTHVHHHGSVSFRKDAEAMHALVLRNHQKFIDKWGVDPHAFI